MYKITFDLPDTGLDGNKVALEVPAKIAPADNDDDMPIRCYPLWSHRSVVGHQPYNSYAPRMTFLQLREVQACTSVLNARWLASMTKEERVRATTWSQTSLEIDDTIYIPDPKLLINSKDEMKVWGYLMTQYNLKPGLQKKWSKRRDGNNTQVSSAAYNGYMDGNWSHNIGKGRPGTTLLSLLFLKDKWIGRIKWWACRMEQPRKLIFQKKTQHHPWFQPNQYL